jgi:hypothetical protein
VEQRHLPGQDPMTSHADRSPARPALSRLPRWVTALGLVLVVGELTAGAAALAKRAPGLAWLGGRTRTVVLQVEGSCAGDSATYTTPTGDGQFDMPAQAGLINCVTHGGPSTPTLQKTFAVQVGGIVTISTFNAYGSYPITCSITVNGQVLSQDPNDGFRGRATCRAKIP